MLSYVSEENRKLKEQNLIQQRLLNEKMVNN